VVAVTSTATASWAGPTATVARPAAGGAGVHVDVPGLPGGVTLSAECAAQRLAAMAAKDRAGITSCTSAHAGTTTDRSTAGGSLPAGIPSRCGNQLWAYTRSTACFDGTYTLVVFTVPGGVIVGTIDYDVLTYMELSPASLTLVQIAEFRALVALGDVAGTVINGSGNCGGGCGRITRSFTTRLFDTSTATAQGAVKGTSSASAPGAIGRHSTGITWWMENPRWLNPVTNSQSAGPAPARCDNTISNQSPGCVFENVTPVHHISSFSFPSHARHVALATGYGVPRTLTRITDPFLQDQNGNMACPASIPKPTGYQCDEYPFRSTREGAFTGNQPYGRTFDGCQITAVPIRQPGDSGGYSICMIPAGENGDAGADLGIFYHSDRVLDGERFTVVVE
jgi:hypothetical protein